MKEHHFIPEHFYHRNSMQENFDSLQKHMQKGIRSIRQIENKKFKTAIVVREREKKNDNNNNK